MQYRLLDLLVCPVCACVPKSETYEERGGRIWGGILVCPCGREYPVVNGIPRMTLPQLSGPSTHLQEQTCRSFGYQWTTFGRMTDAFREGFLNYIAPLTFEFFRGKLGLDAGCGFGRHLYYAVDFGAQVLGMDVSSAVEIASRETSHLPGAHVIQADIYCPPFRAESFDFVYSIGVLHHLPDPETGFRKILKLVKPGGAIFIWVYSSSRRLLNAGLEGVRAVTTRLPFGFLRWLSYAGAATDWGWILPYRLLLRSPGRGFAERVFPPRIRLYARYPFHVAVADWFDRLSAPVRFYYDQQDLQGWAVRADLRNVRITSTGHYGWRLYGER